MTTTHGVTQHEHHDLRNAWIALVAFPFVVLIAMVLGEFAVSALGYDVTGTVPGWVKAVVGIPTVLLAVAPAALSAWLADRARREGDQRAVVPLMLAVAAGAGFVLLNLVSVVFG
jgi:uncharacterized membrane protein